MKYLVDGQSEDISIFEGENIKLLIDKGLISQNNDKITSLFVGRLITPNGNYYSLPKNFEKSDENKRLTEKLILKYKDLKINDDLLITNYSFTPKESGETSERIFFNKLKEFFLDYITYEFVFPRKKKNIHSSYPMRGGKIDVLKTINNQERYGYGVTYKTKDVVNTKEWKLDDIYYYTLNELCEKYGLEKDKEDVEKMKKYLVSEGYIIRPYEFIDDHNTIIDIKKCEVGIIHNPIKNTLLGYYNSKLVGYSYQLRLYYTKFFNLVWQEVIREVLKNDKEFENEIEKEFPTISKFVSNKEKDDTKSYREKLNPDVFSNWNSKKFLGDAKYYSNTFSHFDKEMYVYNELTKNKYPIVAFIPTDKDTKRISVDRHGEFELIVMVLSSKDVLLDLFEKDRNKVINRVHQLINKHTRRQSWYQ